MDVVEPGIVWVDWSHSQNFMYRSEGFDKNLHTILDVVDLW
jgi:hypothetical protein